MRIPRARDGRPEVACAGRRRARPRGKKGVEGVQGEMEDGKNGINSGKAEGVGR